MHLIGCSCPITLSADTCHCYDISIRMHTAASTVSFTSLHALWETPFPSHSLDDVNNRDALAGCVSSASPSTQAASSCTPHSDAASVVRSSLPASPSSIDPVCSEDWWGSVVKFTARLNDALHCRSVGMVSSYNGWLCSSSSSTSL